MSTGVVSNLAQSSAVAVFLAALIVSMSGCDIAAAPSPPQRAADATQAADPPGVRYRLDTARNRMWVLSPDGVFLFDTNTPRLIAEVKLPAWQAVDAPYSCLPDLALGPKGEAVVTSNIVPTLWRIDPDTLAVSSHELVLDADKDKDIGFSGLVYSPEHRAYFAVSDVHGSLWRIDSVLRKAQKIRLAAPIRKACGITVPLRLASDRTQQFAALCVHARPGRRIVNLAPDQRSAHVTDASCTAPLMHQMREGD